MNKEMLVVSSKYPTPGEVKTRLGEIIGQEKAASLAEAMLKDLCQVHTTEEYDFVIETNSSESKEKFTELIKRVQVRAGLGKFLRGPNSLTYEVFKHYLSERSRVVMISSDTPAVDRLLVHQCFNLLQDVDVVIGPDFDGGYYLIGMSRPFDLFTPLPETRCPYLKLTVNLMELLRIGYVLIEPRRDVDDLDDLRQINWGTIVGWEKTSQKAKEILHVFCV